MDMRLFAIEIEGKEVKLSFSTRIMRDELDYWRSALGQVVEMEKLP